MVKSMLLKQNVFILLVAILFGVACNKTNHTEKQSKESSESVVKDSTQIKKANEKNMKGLLCLHADQRDSALFYLKEAYSIMEQEEGETLFLIKLCINIADCYHQASEYPLSVNYYKRALFLSDSSGITKQYFSIYSGLGRLYNEIDNKELADEYYRKAERYYDTGTTYEQYYYANSRGNYYYDTKEYEQALEWFRTAYQLTGPSTQYAATRAIVEANLGEIFILLQVPDSARFYLNRSKESWGEHYHTPSVNFYVEGLFASLSLLENKVNEAERLLLTQEKNRSDVISQYVFLHNRRMQELYERKHDYKKAYHYKTQADLYDDSLRNVKMQHNIAEIEFRYQQDTTLYKKDLQIAETRLEVSQWKGMTQLSLFLFVIVLFCIGGVYLYKKRSRELKYSRQLATIHNLRMEITRNRISPHFTFNVLHAIMPALDEYKELEHPFRLLIQMLRANLRASEQISVPLSEEISLVKNYLQLYEINHPDRIQINWNIAEDVPLDTSVLSMSIQIPVENAVKYAFPEIMAHPQIHINISRFRDAICISVEDNGIGFHPPRNHQDERGTGYGLRMLYNTTELLNHHNIQKMKFEIQNKSDGTAPNAETGTHVFISVPVHYKFDI